MALTHQNVEDINHKYNGSVLYYNKKPIMCFGADPYKKVKFEYLGPGYSGGMNLDGAAVNDAKFADGPFRLGYVNGLMAINKDGEKVETVAFVTRVPIRKWKQGLTGQNIQARGPGQWRFELACKTQGMVDMLVEQYPSFWNATKALAVKMPMIAYHRHWAVGLNEADEFDLYYRGNKVGQADTPRKLAPSAKFEFLLEAYQLSK
jgi:hypothetical protein